MKALVLGDYKPEQFDRIRTLGYELVTGPEGGAIPYDLAGDAEIMVSYKEIENIDFDKMPNLKVVQLTSIGIDYAPKDEALKRDIKIANNKGCFSLAMGEWIVMNILELFKRRAYFYKNQQEKIWKPTMDVLELYKKTVGFFGTGTISQEAAKRLAGFDVTILGMNTSGRTVPYIENCYSFDERFEMAARCDVIICAMPSNDKTYHIIDENLIDAMKDGSMLINIGRGEAVDETALISALNSGKLRGAALDVFKNEPLEKDSPLWETENLYLTSHNSWVSEKCMDRIFETAFENLRRYIMGEELANVVDISKGY